MSPKNVTVWSYILIRTWYFLVANLWRVFLFFLKQFNDLKCCTMKRSWPLRCDMTSTDVLESHRKRTSSKTKPGFCKHAAGGLYYRTVRNRLQQLVWCSKLCHVNVRICTKHTQTHVFWRVSVCSLTQPYMWGPTGFIKCCSCQSH